MGIEIKRCPICRKRFRDDPSLVKKEFGCLGKHEASEFHKCAECDNQCLKTWVICYDCYCKKNQAKKELIREKSQSPDSFVQDKIIEIIRSGKDGILSDVLMNTITLPANDVFGAIVYMRLYGKIRTRVSFQSNNEFHAPKVYLEIIKQKVKKAGMLKTRLGWNKARPDRRDAQCVFLKTLPITFSCSCVQLGCRSEDIKVYRRVPYCGGCGAPLQITGGYRKVGHKPSCPKYDLSKSKEELISNDK